MLFALSIAQAHNIIPHIHEEVHSQVIQNDHESPHFELSDIFSRFSHLGNTLTFAHITKILKNNLNYTITFAFHYTNIKLLPDTKPIQLCIRENPDLCNSEVNQTFSLRAPPFLIS